MSDNCSNYDENKKSYDYKNDFDNGNKEGLINCINVSIKNKMKNLNTMNTSNENLNENTLKLYETNILYVSFKVIIFLILFYYYYVLL